VRTTVTIDADVHEAVQHLAQVSGKRYGEVLSELARRGLNPPEPAHKKKARFPTFTVPPGTPVISMKKVQEFLDEEGIL
jgi:hypothetical protein